MNLAEACYRLTGRFPKDEQYGLTSQVRRSAVSVPANIAEGYGREAKGAYAQHLKIAQGSLKEVETHLLLSERIGLIGKDDLSPLLSKSESIGKMLRRLIRAIEKSE